MTLGWFRKLMPRKDRFFDLFAEHASTVVSGAEALQKLLAGGDNVEPQCRGLEAAILEIRPPFTI
jgi:uncharacterized protein Yka (UPF0111/DUF47 family)